VDSLVLRAAASAARLLPSGARRALYRLGPITQGLRALLNRSVPEGITPVTIAAGDLAGAQLLLDLRLDKDLWLGTYEPDMQRALRDLTRPGMIVYDLGANIGYMTLLFAKAVGETGRVVAVEPLPANVARLRAAVELNQMQGRVTVVERAIGPRRGREMFLVHRSPGMGRLEQAPGRAESFQDAVEVEVASVDDLVYAEGFPPPHLVKMDLEGGEGRALEGMGRLLRDVKPLLLIEVHGRIAAAETWARLATAGYAVRDLGRGRRVVRSPAELRPKAYIVAEIEGGPL
jgi:FkbM family methyltransferase